MEGGKAHFGAVAGKSEDECRLVPDGVDGAVPGEMLGMAKEHGAKERQGNADRADEQVFPHGFEGLGRAVEADERCAEEGGGFDGDPDEAGVAGYGYEGHGSKEGPEAGQEGAASHHAAGVGAAFNLAREGDPLLGVGDDGEVEE